MSCTQNRKAYFERLSAEGSPVAFAFDTPAIAAETLERLFQAGYSRRPPEDHLARQQETARAKAATLLLFARMRRLGIEPPVHSASGLPKLAAQRGYLAVQEALRAIEQGEPLPPLTREVYSQVRTRVWNASLRAYLAEPSQSSSWRSRPDGPTSPNEVEELWELASSYRGKGLRDMLSNVQDPTLQPELIALARSLPEEEQADVEAAIRERIAALPPFIEDPILGAVADRHLNADIVRMANGRSPNSFGTLDAIASIATQIDQQIPPDQRATWPTRALLDRIVGKSGNLQSDYARAIYEVARHMAHANAEGSRPRARRCDACGQLRAQDEHFCPARTSQAKALIAAMVFQDPLAWVDAANGVMEKEEALRANLAQLAADLTALPDAHEDTSLRPFLEPAETPSLSTLARKVCSKAGLQMCEPCGQMLVDPSHYLCLSCQADLELDEAGER